MNDSLNVLKSIYKPYRYTLKGSVMILETTSGTFVVKDKENDLSGIYNYLKSRNFTNFPKLIDESRNSVNVFEYIEDVKMPKEQKAQDMVNLVSNLHNKTTYFKDVTDDEFKSIYDNILNNLNYLKESYEKYYNNFFSEVMMSPSHYLFMRNYSKINNCLKFCHDELDKWFDMVKNEHKTRVSLVHNNLSIEHFIKSDQDYLISWEHARVDTPVLDLINFYHNDFFDLNFEELLKSYFQKYDLTESEKKLFFIMISTPPEINFSENEFTSSLKLRKKLDYIYKTENLIRPYYLDKHKEENTNLN
jgi:thiamine kinase-like enzyme